LEGPCGDHNVVGLYLSLIRCDLVELIVSERCHLRVEHHRQFEPDRVRFKKVGDIVLTRVAIARSRKRFADANGIESLSMRKLGQELGAEAMSLYKHVANKDDMLDGMVDVVFSEIDLPSDGVHWKVAMRERAVSAREALSRHPWALGLTESRMRPGPTNLRHHDSVIKSLREASFSIEMAMHAYSALDSYIYGCALQEKSLPFDTSDDVGEAAENVLGELPADEYPYLAETVVEHIMKSGWKHADEFAFGLDLILDGLEQRDMA
jgi:AcrR family transcriptional regulator